MGRESRLVSDLLVMLRDIPPLSTWYSSPPWRMGRCGVWLMRSLYPRPRPGYTLYKELSLEEVYLDYVGAGENISAFFAGLWFSLREFCWNHRLWYQITVEDCHTHHYDAFLNGQESKLTFSVTALLGVGYVDRYAASETGRAYLNDEGDAAVTERCWGRVKVIKQKEDAA